MRDFTFVNKGINTDTHEQEWELIEEIHHWWKLNENIRYDKIYSNKDIIDFLKLFALNKHIRLKFT